MIKVIIGKKICSNKMLPNHLIVDKIEINYAKSTAKKFNKFFVNIRPNLANKMLQSDLSFESNLPTVNTTLNKTALSEDEFAETSKSLE